MVFRPKISGMNWFGSGPCRDKASDRFSSCDRIAIPTIFFLGVGEVAVNSSCVPGLALLWANVVVEESGAKKGSDKPARTFMPARPPSVRQISLCCLLPQDGFMSSRQEEGIECSQVWPGRVLLSVDQARDPLHNCPQPVLS